MKKRIIAAVSAVGIISAAAPAVLCVYADDVSQKNEKVSFSMEVTQSSDVDEADGTIKVTIDNGSDEDKYYLSLDGKKYRLMKSTEAVIKNLSAGCHTVSIIKNKDMSTQSEIHSVYVGCETEIFPININASFTPEKFYSDGSLNVHIENYIDGREYEITIDGGKSWQAVNDDDISFDDICSDDYKIQVRQTDDIQNESWILNASMDIPSLKGKGFIDAKMIMQSPELPTGCEITSLTMLLNFIGFDADKLDMADNYLPKGEYRKTDFKDVFVGNPRDYNAYGCFAKPIIKAAKDYLDDHDKNDEWQVVDMTGCPALALYRAIDNGHPSAVWASGKMGEIYAGRTWTVEATGETITWPANEHCLLLTGYDTEKKLVYFNDPMVGKTSYSMELFEKRFEQMGNQAVIIVNKNS